MGSFPAPVDKNGVMETKRVRFVEPVTHQSPTLRCHEGDQTCYIQAKGESRPEIQEAARSGESSLVACPAISGKSLSLPLTSLSAKTVVSDAKTRVTETPSWVEKNDEDLHSQTESGRQPFRFLANSVSISVNSRSQEPQKRQVKSHHEKDVMEDSYVTRVSKSVSCVSDFEAEQVSVSSQWVSIETEI